MDYQTRPEIIHGLILGFDELCRLYVHQRAIDRKEEALGFGDKLSQYRQVEKWYREVEKLDQVGELDRGKLVVGKAQRTASSGQNYMKLDPVFAKFIKEFLRDLLMAHLLETPFGRELLRIDQHSNHYHSLK